MNAAAIGRNSTVALVSDGGLWLVSGADRSVQLLLPASDQPQDPVFSADGRWLEMTATAVPGRSGNGEVWLVRSDGTDLHPLPPDTTSAVWSPRGHRLAVEAADGRGPVATLAVLTPGSGRRGLSRLRNLYYPYPAVWAPNGKSLVVDTGTYARRGVRGRTSLVSYPIDGGRSTTWLSRDFRRGRLDGMNELEFPPVGWWPHLGIAFRVFGDGQTDSPDQAPVYILHAPGGPPRRLASVPTSDSATQIAATGAGKLAVVRQTGADGFGRLIWQHKHLETCTIGASSCTQLPAARGTVTLDPTWSASGRQLAYVQAPTLTTDGFPYRVVHRWYAAHHLEVWNAATGTSQAVPDSAGASAPQWSARGETLMYVDRDSIWIRKPGTTHPVRVASPLFSTNAWPTYYGQVDWIGQYAWTSDTS